MCKNISTQAAVCFRSATVSVTWLKKVAKKPTSEKNILLKCEYTEIIEILLHTLYINMFCVVFRHVFLNFSIFALNSISTLETCTPECMLRIRENSKKKHCCSEPMKQQEQFMLTKICKQNINKVHENTGKIVLKNMLVVGNCLSGFLCFLA